MWSKNPRITPKDRNAIKGALRRAYSRSDIRKMVIDRTIVKHSDPSRPRVKRWSKCEKCGELTPTYLIDADHITPVIPIHSHFDEMPLDESVERLWCELSNMQGICESCHDQKTAEERAARKPYQKPRTKKRK